MLKLYKFANILSDNIEKHLSDIYYKNDKLKLI